MRSELFTFANQLTLLRFVLVPFFALALHEQRLQLALVLFAVATVSDGLDGMLARLLNQRTALGAYLDPIADKLLQATAFLLLAFLRQVPWTLTILLLGRDVLILAIAGVILLVTGFRPFSPSLYGKASTVAANLTVLLILGDSVLSWAWLGPAKNFFIWLTAALVVISGLHYGYQAARVLPGLPQKPG